MIMNQEKETVEVKMEKKQRFWDFLTMILSISYAIALLIMGENLHIFVMTRHRMSMIFYFL